MRTRTGDKPELLLSYRPHYRRISDIRTLKNLLYVSNADSVA